MFVFTHNGREYLAHLLPDGSILWDDGSQRKQQRYKSLSPWALACIHQTNPTRKSVDGWKSVRFRAPPSAAPSGASQQDILLDEVRARYLGTSSHSRSTAGGSASASGEGSTSAAGEKADPEAPGPSKPPPAAGEKAEPGAPGPSKPPPAKRKKKKARTKEEKARDVEQKRLTERYEQCISLAIPSLLAESFLGLVDLLYEEGLPYTMTQFADQYLRFLQQVLGAEAYRDPNHLTMLQQSNPNHIDNLRMDVWESTYTHFHQFDVDEPGDDETEADADMD